MGRKLVERVMKRTLVVDVGIVVVVLAMERGGWVKRARD